MSAKDPNERGRNPGQPSGPAPDPSPAGRPAAGRPLASSRSPVLLGESAILELPEAAGQAAPATGTLILPSGAMELPAEAYAPEPGPPLSAEAIKRPGLTDPSEPELRRRDYSLGNMATVHALAVDQALEQLAGDPTPAGPTTTVPTSEAQGAYDAQRKPTLRQDKIPDELMRRLREADAEPGPGPRLPPTVTLPARDAASRPGEPSQTGHVGAPEATRLLPALPREEATRQLSLPRGPLPTLVTQALPTPEEPGSEPQSAQTLKRGNAPGTRPEATVVLAENSLGALATQAFDVASAKTPETKDAGDESGAKVTAVRPVFRGMTYSPLRSRGQRTTKIILRTVFSLRAGLVLLSVATVLAMGWFGYSYYAREQHIAQLGSAARSGFQGALLRGRLADFIDGEQRLRARLQLVPLDAGARRARAFLLHAARYEFGGGPALPDGDWEQEALSAGRQIESERNAVARAALLLSALAQGDLAAAEQHLRLLPREPADEEYAMPAGMLDYLSAQVALLGGRTDESLVALRRAVERSPLPLWQRRLGFWLLQKGQEEPGRLLLHTALGREPELCGAQIDLAYARGRTGEAPVRNEARRVLQGLTEPPRIGPDPCGRGERAWAAILLSELSLREDGTARPQALLLLKQALTLSPPTDLVLREALAEALLMAGDSEGAVAQLRDVLGRLPQRRSSRLLLSRALLRAKRGHDALQALEPLLDGRGGRAGDPEALLLKVRALLSQTDTLEARREVERVLESAGPQQQGVRFEAQLLLAEIDLSLRELAAARRVLEPLMQQLSPQARGPRPGREQQLDAQLLWARVLLAQQPPQTSEARALLESVRAQAPERVEVRLLLGRLLRELGVWSQAEQELSAALRADEQSGAARRELATLLLLRGDTAKAREQFGALLRDEQDADLHILMARCQRLDGAPAEALQTLTAVRRSRGEITTKYDEALLAERARALLALGRAGEAAVLLRPPVLDQQALRHPTLMALLARAHVALALAGPQRQAEIARARQILQRVPPAWASDPDVRLAVAEMLSADRNVVAARSVLGTLLTQLETVSATGTGEETALRQQAQRLLQKLGR